MVSIKSILTSILFACIIVFPVHAQLNLELLDETPTPTPLPEGQQYILEIEQIDINNASESSKLTSLSPTEKSEFEENGFITRSLDASSEIFFSIDRTQIAFSSFLSQPIQKKDVLLSISPTENIGFQLIMDSQSEFASTGSTKILPTQCNNKNICTSRSAQQWTDDVTGWGYTMSGSYVPSDFMEGEWFRSISTEESITLLDLGLTPKKNISKLTWKVIAPELADGTYSTIVKLFAISY